MLHRPLYGVAIEAYEASPAAQAALVELIQHIWATEHVPEDMVTGTQILIHKGKKNKEDRGGYRPIVLDQHEKKSLENCFLQRLLLEMDEAPLGNFLGPEAFGFRKNMGCRDAIVLLDCCMDRMHAAQKETWVCYADVRAAFTSVSHKATDRSLHAARGSAKTRRIFRRRAMYCILSGVQQRDVRV